MLPHVSIDVSFLLLKYFLLHTKCVYPFIHLLIGICVVSTLQLLWIKILWTLICKLFFWWTFAFFSLGLIMELLGHMERDSFHKKQANRSSKWLYHFIPSIAMSESWNCFIYSRTVGFLMSNFSYSSGYGVMYHCDFNLHFPGD